MNVASAQVDHFRLQPGLYLQEVLTLDKNCLFVYDLRMISPVEVNEYGYEGMSQPVIHTIEHLLAVNCRDVAKRMMYIPSSIVSVFPYGCATGFGVISTLEPSKFSHILKMAIDASLQAQVVLFAEARLCGNYTMQNLKGAHSRLLSYKSVLDKYNWEVFKSPLIGDNIDEGNLLPWE